MNGLKPIKIACPYCGEKIKVEIDCSVEQQSYVEDCQVCCRPIEFSVMVDQSGKPTIEVSREDD